MRAALLACLGLVVCTGSLVAARPAAAELVVAVVTEPAVAPYRAVLDEFRTACACRVREIAPAEARAEGFERRLREAGATAVLAIGMPARDAVADVRGLPVISVMAPRLEAWVAEAGNRLGVEMALSPGRHLEAIRRVFPGVRRVGAIHDPALGGDHLRGARSAAEALGLTLLVRDVARPGDVPAAAASLFREIDLLWLVPDSTVLAAGNLDLLLLASFQARVPIHAFARKYVELGAVAALHTDPGGLGRQAGELLGRHLAPRAAPRARFEHADRAELVLNRKVARKMGIALPAGALEEAADVLR